MRKILFRIVLSFSIFLLMDSTLEAQTPDCIASDCPEIEVIELNNIPGFAQTDELMICGASDTLAFLIYLSLIHI